EDSGVMRDLEFSVMQGLPRTLLLGMPAIHAFKMDLLFSTNELQFFSTGVLSRSDATPTVRRYTTPLKSYRGMSTLSPSRVRHFDYSRVFVHQPEVIPPNATAYVRCIAEFPRVVHPVYELSPSADRLGEGLTAARTLYAHGDMFLHDPQGSLSPSSINRTFMVSVYNENSQPFHLFKGTVVATISHNPIEAAIPISEERQDDVPHTLSLLTQLCASKNSSDVVNVAHVHGIKPPGDSPRSLYVSSELTAPSSVAPSPSSDHGTGLAAAPSPWISAYDDPWPFVNLLHEDSPIDYESLTDPSKFLPTRRPVKDPSDEDKMDYLKDNTIVSDEDLWKQFQTDHIKSPSVLERLRTLVIKMGDIFRPYVVTGDKVAGQHTIQLQPFARAPNVPPYPENAVKTAIIDEHVSKMLADD
ncbi:hypothetical protein HDU96_003952, partial [Phlyctochytrium bullatum]